MYDASLESVLRVILIILLVYFGFKIFIRWFGPKILRYFLKKIGGQFQKQYEQRSRPASEKEGEVVIEKRPKRGKDSNKEVGEYIDYEEID